MAREMDSETLRTVIRIAAVGSLTRAAEITGLSQPSLTRLVRDLEAELQVELFERGRRGMKLTEAGHRFCEGAGEALEGLDRLARDTASPETPVSGSIGVGVPHSMTADIALPLMRWLREAHPQASVSLQQGVSHEIEQELLFGQIDVGVLISPQTQAPLRSARPLASEPLHLFHAPADRPVRAAHAGWEDLSDRPLILPRRQNVLRRRLDQTAAQKGIALRVVAEVSNPEATLQLVAEGIGATILPASLGAGRVAAGLLAGVPFGRESVVWSLGVSTHAAGTRLRSLVEARIALLFDEQIAAGRWRSAGQPS